MSDQPQTAFTSLVPKDEKKPSDEHQMHFIGNSCIVNETSQAATSLSHIFTGTPQHQTHWVLAFLSLSHPPPSPGNPHSKSGSLSTVFDSCFRQTENELADLLLWIDGFIYVGEKQPRDYERLVQLGWFDRFHEAVLEGCPSLEMVGLTALDGFANAVDWSPRADLDSQRLTGMYDKLIQPRVEQYPERDDEENERPTPPEVFKLWQRFLSGDELGRPLSPILGVYYTVAKWETKHVANILNIAGGEEKKWDRSSVMFPELEVCAKITAQNSSRNGLWLTTQQHKDRWTRNSYVKLFNCNVMLTTAVDGLVPGSSLYYDHASLPDEQSTTDGAAQKRTP
ncbi:hypothetical protein DL96DRAFT_1689150 [Flagelloscypha sp. PMI_526]|nr:hypothetical protein DL96DRAFT_1689150 [Flagelloscypha sp. PMI_526]